MNVELTNPVAQVDEVLSKYPETLRLQACAWVLARDVSPRITPLELLTQLGEKCPGVEHADTADNSQSAGCGSGDNGATWKDQRPCTPRGDRKSMFGGNASSCGEAETQTREIA